MKTFITALIRQSRTIRGTAAALLAVGALVGCGISTAVTNATAFEGRSQPVALHKGDKSPADELKIGLIGSYRVSGTDTDGKAYPSGGIVDVGLAPSGSLELTWDNGRQLGVGQVVGHTLVVSHLANGRTAIMVMHINPDGTLSGTWSRRTDRGYRGTETWKKI
jgi:hypothetical protein